MGRCRNIIRGNGTRYNIGGRGKLVRGRRGGRLALALVRYQKIKKHESNYLRKRKLYNSNTRGGKQIS